MLPVGANRAPGDPADYSQRLRAFSSSNRTTPATTPTQQPLSAVTPQCRPAYHPASAAPPSDVMLTCTRRVLTRNLLSPPPPP